METHIRCLNCNDVNRLAPAQSLCEYFCQVCCDRRNEAPEASGCLGHLAEMAEELDDIEIQRLMFSKYEDTRKIAAEEWERRSNANL